MIRLLFKKYIYLALSSMANKVGYLCHLRKKLSSLLPIRNNLIANKVIFRNFSISCFPSVSALANIHPVVNNTFPFGYCSFQFIQLFHLSSAYTGQLSCQFLIIFQSAERSLSHYGACGKLKLACSFDDCLKYDFNMKVPA